MEGLNLGLAVRMSDFASVNAQKISSSIEKLLKLAGDFPHTAGRAGTAGTHLGTSLGSISSRGHQAAGGINSLSHSLSRATPNLIDFRAGIIRLFPYISVAAGVYAIKRGVASIVETAREFKSSLANLQAAAGYSGTETKWLEGQLRGLAKGSVFSAKEIADSAYDLGTIMEIPVQKLPSLQKAVLDYASATQYSVKETGLDILSLLVKMNRPLSDAPKLLDKMSYATNITSLNAKTLSEMMKVVGTEAIMMKVPFSEMLSIFGATDLQFKGSEGATRLRMIFQGLARDTKLHREVLSHYGLTMKDVDVKSQGFTKVMERLKGISYNDATRLVEGYSAGLLIQLTQSTDKINELTGKIERNAAGTTARMKAIQLASLDGQLKLWKQTETELKLTMNDSMEGPFARELGKVNGFITFVTDQMRKHKAVLDVLFNGIANVVDVIGSRVARWIKGIMTWMGLMGDSTHETQQYIKNNLIPFVVWMEVMAIRTMNFLVGFKDGFLGTARVLFGAIMFFVEPLLWLFNVIFPTGGDKAYNLGVALGVLAFSFFAVSMAAKVATMWTALFGEVGLLSVIGNIGTTVRMLIGQGGLMAALEGAGAGAAGLTGYLGLAALAMIALWGSVEAGKATYQHWGEWMDWLGDKWNYFIIDFLKGVRIAAAISDVMFGTNLWKSADQWTKDAEDVQGEREARRGGMSAIQWAAQRDEKRKPKGKLIEAAYDEPQYAQDGTTVVDVVHHEAGEWSKSMAAQKEEWKRRQAISDQLAHDRHFNLVPKKFAGPTIEEGQPYQDPAMRRGPDGGEWHIVVDPFIPVPKPMPLPTTPVPNPQERVMPLPLQPQPDLLGVAKPMATPLISTPLKPKEQVMPLTSTPEPKERVAPLTSTPEPKESKAPVMPLPLQQPDLHGTVKPLAMPMMSMPMKSKEQAAPVTSKPQKPVMPLSLQQSTEPTEKAKPTPTFNMFGDGIVRGASAASKGSAVPSPTATPAPRRSAPVLSKTVVTTKKHTVLEKVAPAIQSPYTAEFERLRKTFAGATGDSTYTFGDMNFYGIKSDDPEAMAKRVMEELKRKMDERTKR